MNQAFLNRADAAPRKWDVSLPGQTDREQPPVLLRYLRTFSRWKWLIAACVALSLIAALILTMLMTPLYSASALLEIQRENDQFVGVQGVEQETNAVDLEFYQTQYGLLESRSLAERVATELRLQDNEAFFDMFGASEVVEQLNSGDAQVRSAAARRERVRQAATILLEHLTVNPERLSRLVEIEFASPDPEFSARVVNAWTDNFIATTLERKFEATSYARSFLEDRLEQLRERLEESERALVGYASNQQIINLPTTTTGESGDSTVERPIVAENLAAINRELNEATADRIAAESRLRRAGGSSAEALQNQAITGLRERRAELASEYARMTTQFEPAYPPARALANQIEELDKAIAREEARVRNTLENAYQSASARESQLASRVASLRGDLLDLRGRTIQYNIHQREVDTNRQLYDALLQRYKEIGVAGGVGVNNVAVVDQGQVPEEPSSPSLILNLLIALLLGTALGVAAALALDQIEDVITDPGDVESELKVPLLGTVPKLDEDPFEQLADPKSPLVEAYISAQTRLAFSTDHGVPRSIVVTSTRPAEGKSTTSYALARALMRTGRKVLLVDGDMRSPAVHGMHGIDNAYGFSNLLAGSMTPDEAIRLQKAGGLDVITAGPQPPNAAELLTSEKFSDLLAQLSTRYDHVLIDAPPVMGLADAPLIAGHVEGTVFVIESHATKANAVKVALARLSSAGGKVVGALLTKFESKPLMYGYGYEYGYGYGRRESETAEA